MTSTTDLVTVAGGNVTVGTPDPMAGFMQQYIQQASAGLTGAVNPYAQAPQPGTTAATSAPAAANGTGQIGDLRGSPMPTSGSSSDLNAWLVANGYPATGAGGAAGAPAGAPTSPVLNMPNMGSGYYDPYTRLLATILGYANSDNQNNIQTLSKLAASPQDAAQLAAYRGLTGLSPFGDNGGDIRNLINSTTSGGGMQTANLPGAAPIQVPNTLSGAQLNMLNGMPGTAGVISSIAGAAGNPDIMARSKAALMPALFGTGSLGFGTQSGFGAGTGLQ